MQRHTLSLSRFDAWLINGLTTLNKYQTVPTMPHFIGSTLRPMHTIDMSGNLNASFVCVSRSVCSIGVCAFSSTILVLASCRAVCAYACAVMCRRNINYKHSANAWKTKWRLFNSICNQSEASNGTHVRLYGRRSTFPMKMHRCHIIDSTALRFVIWIAERFSRWKMLYVIQFGISIVQRLTELMRLMTIHSIGCTNEWKKNYFELRVVKMYLDRMRMSSLPSSSYSLCANTTQSFGIFQLLKISMIMCVLVGCWLAKSEEKKIIKFLRWIYRWLWLASSILAALNPSSTTSKKKLSNFFSAADVRCVCEQEKKIPNARPKWRKLKRKFAEKKLLYTV